MTTPSITAARLERLISAERFATFLHAEPDPDVAVALYMRSLFTYETLKSQDNSRNSSTTSKY